MQNRAQDQVLETIERYFGIRDDDAEALLGGLDSVDIAGGDWLFKQGEAADALYFLVRGRLQVWVEPEVRGSELAPRLLGEITPGESVGEIGLLTGGVRTAGIRAIRDSQLLRLDRQAFEHFAVRHPNLVMQLAGGVARRLTERTRPGSSASRNLSTVALVPLGQSPWLPDFCDRLTDELRKRVSTLCLSSADLGKDGAPVDALSPEDSIPGSLHRWLDARENDHRLLIYVADEGDTPWSRLCIRQADMILLLGDAGADPAPSQWETQLLDSDGATTARRALILHHADRDSPIADTIQWLEGRDIEFHLHLRGDSDAETSRIVRMLMGDSVGLVLGGGAARGFAEVGAYRAMHEAGVPIDWVGGTSIGGIIGAAIALDQGPDYVTENSRKAFVEGKPFGDYTLPVLSLIRGRRMEKLTRHHLQGNIEDLPIPFFCISALLDNGEMRVHERGSIWRALRATAALPGMLPPAVMEQRLVVDGSTVNNLPIDIMREKPVGRVVAVDVTTRRTYSVDYDDMPSPWSVIAGKLIPWKQRYRVPGVISVLMKSAEIGTAARVREMGRDADLLIRPPVSEFGLTDVKSFDRIVEAGYDHAREQIAKWMSKDERVMPRSD
jgi:predicted acylesterase/phospholipase RssA/CRP-like cAMP-binding protein